MDEHRRFLLSMGATATLLSVCARFIDWFPLSDMTSKNGIAILILVYVLLLLIDMDYVRHRFKD